MEIKKAPIEYGSCGYEGDGETLHPEAEALATELATRWLKETCSKSVGKDGHQILSKRTISLLNRDYQFAARIEAVAKLAQLDADHIHYCQLIEQARKEVLKWIVTNSEIEKCDPDTMAYFQDYLRIDLADWQAKLKEWGTMTRKIETLRWVKYGDWLFLPVCPTCGHFVKADETILINGLGDYKRDEPNATCARCGRVIMPCEGTI